MVERFHSITPSLHHFLLDIWKPAFEAFHCGLNKLKISSHAATYDTGNREEAIECTLKDTSKAKNGDVSSSTR